MAKNEAEIANAATCAPVNARFANSPYAIMGCFFLCWITTKLARSTAAAISSAIMPAEDQPSVLPRTRARTSRNRPAHSVACP